MSFASLLAHRARVSRPTGRTDRFNQPDGSASTPAVEIACRLSTARGKEQMTERSRDVIVASHTLYVHPNADIREDDEIEVRDPETNTVLITGARVTLIRRPYGMRNVHHKECQLELIRGSTDGTAA